LQQVDHAQADDQRQGAHHLEIDERDGPRLADCLHALHAGDPRHHGTENNGGNDHLDQFHETIAEGFHIGAQARIEVPQQYSDGDGQYHLKVEAADYFLVHAQRPVN